MKHFIIFFIPGLISTTAFAQPDSLWSRTYGGTGDDYCYAMDITADGGYILAGSTTSFGSGSEDMWLVKTDANGDSLWSRTFGGNSSDVCYSVQQTSDGGYILAGSTRSFGAGGLDMWLVKTDSNGDSLWSRTFGDSLEDVAYAVVQSSDGDYVLTGYMSGEYEGWGQWWLVRTDANGDSLLSRPYGGNAVQQTTDGGYILAGYTLTRTSANCDSLWSRPTGWAIGAHSVQQTSDGGYVWAGDLQFLEIQSAALGRTDANGNELWSRFSWEWGWQTANAVQQTSDGGYVAVGQVGQPGEMILMRFNASGDSLWSLRFGFSESGASAHAVGQTSDGGYALAGYTGSYWGIDSDVWLIRIGPDILPAPTGLVACFMNGQLVLRWNTDSYPYYRIYSGDTPEMTSPAFEGSTSDTSFAITDVSAARRFYYVVGSIEP